MYMFMKLEKNPNGANSIWREPQRPKFGVAEGLYLKKINQQCVTADELWRQKETNSRITFGRIFQRLQELRGSAVAEMDYTWKCGVEILMCCRHRICID